MCRKRSSRLGGNFMCAVNRGSKCPDIIQEPRSGIYVSVKACQDINVGEMTCQFLFFCSLMKYGNGEILI